MRKLVPHSIPSWHDCYDHKSDSFIKHDDQHVSKSTDNNHFVVTFHSLMHIAMLTLPIMQVCLA